jgi:predicted metal-dependent enzyme (double-stranded beta helix superfamily)
MLVAEIREVVSRGLPEAETGEGVANVLKRHVNDSSLLRPEDRVGDEEAYKQHILHVEDDGSFSIVSLVWLPGQDTPIHDHVSWCVVGVHQGTETEELYETAGDGDEKHLITTDNHVNPEGFVVWLSPPGDIHKVTNTGESKAISLHVYGADISVLGTSIRRRYDLPVKG